MDGYIADLVSSVQKAHKVARSKLKMVTKRMKRNYDLRIVDRMYAVKDPVYTLDKAAVKGECKKLGPPWKGQGVVVTKLSACLYRVKLRNVIMVLNHDKIKLCRDRTLPLWICHWKENPEVEEPATTSEKIYCSCRQHQGWFMIQCDHCHEWYHRACVNITTPAKLRLTILYFMTAVTNLQSS